MLGHSCLSATNIYIRVAGTEVKRTHSMSHPRERDKEPKESAIPDIRYKKAPNP